MKLFVNVRRLLLLLSVALGTLIFTAGSAFAADGVTADEQADWLSLSEPTNLVRLLGIVIPIVTALITKSSASSGLKSVVTTALSAVTATVVYVVAADGGGYDWQGFLNAFLNTFIPAIVLYYGLYKPTGVTTRVNVSTGAFGLGPSA